MRPGLSEAEADRSMRLRSQIAWRIFNRRYRFSRRRGDRRQMRVPGRVPLGPGRRLDAPGEEE